MAGTTSMPQTGSLDSGAVIVIRVKRKHRQRLVALVHGIENLSVMHLP